MKLRKAVVETCLNLETTVYLVLINIYVCMYIPSGLKINKKPVFAPISEDFILNWENILRRAEYSLVQLILTESQKVIKKLHSDIENELRNFGYDSRDQVYLGLEQKHTDFKKSLEKRRSKKWQRFRELHHQELQTNRSVNKKPQVMLPIANGNNHSAVVRASTDKDIETSIATENIRGNDVTKTTSETPIVEIKNIDVAASLQDNLGKISEENITDNCVRRQRTKTKHSEMQGIGLNNSIGEAICRVKRKIYAEVARNDKTIPSSKVSVNFSDIVSDLLEPNKSNSSTIETSSPRLCTNSAESPNSSNVLMEGCDSMTFSTQDRELVSILENLQNTDFTGHNNSTETSQLKGYFCSETVFCLSKKVLTEAEI